MNKQTPDKGYGYQTCPTRTFIRCLEIYEASLFIHFFIVFAKPNNVPVKFTEAGKGRPLADVQAFFPTKGSQRTTPAPPKQTSASLPRLNFSSSTSIDPGCEVEP